MFNIKSHYVMQSVGSRLYKERVCNVRALVLDGQPSIFHITDKQYRAAKKKCGILTGDGDYLVRRGILGDTRLMVCFPDKSFEMIPTK